MSGDFDILNQKMTNFAIEAGKAIGTLQTSDKKTNDAIKLLVKAVELLLADVQSNTNTATQASLKARESLEKATQAEALANKNKAVVGALEELSEEFTKIGVDSLVEAANHLLSLYKAGNSGNQTVPPDVQATLQTLSDQLKVIKEKNTERDASIESIKTKVGNGTINTELGTNLIDAVNKAYKTAKDNAGNSGGSASNQDIQELSQKVQTMEGKLDLSGLSSDYDNNKDTLTKALNKVMTEAKVKTPPVDLTSIRNDIATIKQKDGQQDGLITSASQNATNALQQAQTANNKLGSTYSLTNLSSDFNGHKNSLADALNHAMTEAKNKGSGSSTDLSGINNEINTIKQKNTQQDTSLQELSGKVTTVEQSNSEIRNQLGSTYNLSSLSADFDGHKDTLSAALQHVMTEAKNKGTGSGGAITGKTLKSVEIVDYPSRVDNDFDHVGNYYKYTYEGSGGDQTIEYIPKTYPMIFQTSTRGVTGTGLADNALNMLVAKESNGSINQTSYLSLGLPTAKLTTPALSGTSLTVGIEYRAGGVTGRLINNSAQTVSVDLGQMLKNVAIPTDNEHAANKKYVDDRIEAALSSGSGSPSPQATPLVLQGRAQYATCKLAPFDGGGNSAAKTKDVIKTNTSGQSITFTNELSFQTTKAGWYRVKVLYTPGTSSGIFLNNGVAKFPETTAPVIAEDAYPPTGYLEFLVKVEANKVYRTNLADKTARNVNITNVHFIVEYAGA